jgi:hypothetical protein
LRATRQTGAHTPRRVGILLFLAVFLGCAVLHHPRPGWNASSRLALVFAIVEQGRFEIDAYHDRPDLATMDKALYRGHVYSDKIIGLSLLAVPVYAVMRLAGAGLGVTPTTEQARYGLRLVAVSVPAALAAVLLWRLLVALGADPRRGLLATALGFHGSMLFGYATVFMPYLPGIAATLGALWLTLLPAGGRIGRGRSIAVGALCGAAILCDYLFGVVIAGVCALFALRAGGPDRSLPTAARMLAWAALAGCLVLGVAVAYALAVFGKPSFPFEFHAVLPYREGMSQGLAGISTPNATALWYLAVHPFRGIFFWTPLWLAAVLGCVRGLRYPGNRRATAALALFCYAAYLTVLSGYFMWWGGWGMGPRLLLPMFAVAPLGLAEVCRPETPRWQWRSVVALGLASVALSLPLSLLDPQLDQGYPDHFLAKLSLGTPVWPPQFGVLARFYGLAWLWEPDVSPASVLAAVTLPLLLVGVAWRAAAADVWKAPSHSDPASMGGDA